MNGEIALAGRPGGEPTEDDVRLGDVPVPGPGLENVPRTPIGLPRGVSSGEVVVEVADPPAGAAR